MKIYILTLAFTIFSFISIFSQEKQPINTSKSSIKWIGEYTFYFGGHEGLINFTEGHFIKTGDVFNGGEFIIDMNSITNTDIETKKANKNIVDHLKDPDFFDVKKFPLAKLAITKVKHFENNQVEIEANMTIKGITKPVKFNADLDYEKKRLTARFKIDRRKWNVNYQSKFKNSVISDAIGFEVTIKL